MNHEILMHSRALPLKWSPFDIHAFNTTDIPSVEVSDLPSSSSPFDIPQAPFSQTKWFRETHMNRNTDYGFQRANELILASTTQLSTPLSLISLLCPASCSPVFIEESHGSAGVDNEGNTTKEKVDGKVEDAEGSGGQGDFGATKSFFVMNSSRDAGVSGFGNYTSGYDACDSV
ncbi:hypothetical protein Tco_1550275 [Tanacetum coccineum]